MIRSCSLLARLSRPRLPHTPYPLPARLGHVLVGFEQRANVHGLAPPEVPVNSPVEGELERAAVKPPGHCQRCCCRELSCVAPGGQRAGTHRTVVLELMATASTCSVVCVCVFARGEPCVDGRNGWVRVLDGGALRLMLLQRSAPEEPSLTSAFSGCAMTEVCLHQGQFNQFPHCPFSAIPFFRPHPITLVQRIPRAPRASQCLVSSVSVAWQHRRLCDRSRFFALRREPSVSPRPLPLAAILP